MEKMYCNSNEKEILQKAVEVDYPVLMIGDTGTGKTSLAAEVAEENDTPLYRLNITGQTGVSEIIGKWVVQNRSMVWVDGLLVDAMKKGKWIVLDEINMAPGEILSRLHSLLDHEKTLVLKEKYGEIISPHKNFRFFATMNPEEEYAGTKELNKAFLSRFPITLHLKYSNYEKDILANRTGIDVNMAERLVMFANELREQKQKDNINYICSTRDLLSCASLISYGFDKMDAFNLSIVNKVDEEDKEKVQKTIELVISDYVTIDSGEDGGEKLEVQSLQQLKDTLDSIRKEKEEADEGYKDIKKALDVERNLVESYKKEIKGIYKEANDVREKLNDMINSKKHITKDEIKQLNKGDVEQLLSLCNKAIYEFNQ